MRGSLIAIILGLASLPAVPAEGAAGFEVKVTLSASKAARSGPIAAALLFHISRTGEWIGASDEVAGAGTVTSWRVVHIANRDYLEMMVGW